MNQVIRREKPAAQGDSRPGVAGEGGLYSIPHRERAVSWQVPVLVLVLTAIAESVVAFVDPRAGMLLHVATVLLLLYSLGRVDDHLARRLGAAMLLIPLVRVLSLALPLSTWPQTVSYLAVSALLLVAMALLFRVESWRAEELGHTLRFLPLQLAMGVGGLGLGWMEYRLLAPAPLIAEPSWQGALLPGLALLVSTGYAEELLFRGFLQSAAVAVVGYGRGILFVAALYAVMSIGYGSALNVLFVFVVGCVFGVFVARTRSLLGVALAHGLANASLFLLWPHLLP